MPTCLRALEKQTFRDFEIVVVDNASSDESREWIAREFADVRVIALNENRFFAGAVNEGIRQTARPEPAEGTSEIVVLLNNDTEAEATWLENLIRALDENPRAGMAATKLRLFDARDKLHSAGDFFRADGIPGNRGVWEIDAGQYDHPQTPPPLFGVCGGACAYRRAMLDEIGLFDEDLQFNCEDVDLNWRARLAGYDCAFAPNAIVYHMLSASGGGAFASFYVGRNFIAVLAKNYPSALWQKYRGNILRAQFAITRDALQHWRGAAARARLRGQLAGIFALPRYLAKRKHVQRLKKVSDSDIENLLS